MIAVRANATTGFICGKAAKRGLRLNPIARRPGTTSSRALQIVGVSNAFRDSRAAESGRLGIAAYSRDHCRSSSLYWEGPRPASVLRSDPFATRIVIAGVPKQSGAQLRLPGKRWLRRRITAVKHIYRFPGEKAGVYLSAARNRGQVGPGFSPGQR